MSSHSSPVNRVMEPTMLGRLPFAIEFRLVLLHTSAGILDHILCGHRPTACLQIMTKRHARPLVAKLHGSAKSIDHAVEIIHAEPCLELPIAGLGKLGEQFFPEYS